MDALSLNPTKENGVITRHIYIIYVIEPERGTGIFHLSLIMGPYECFSITKAMEGY